MMSTTAIFPLFLGIVHCFEADHVLAVATVGPQQGDQMKHMMYKGVTWGIGHSIPILIIGLIYALSRVFLLDGVPFSLEIPVGVVLISAGLFRLIRTNKAESTETHLKTVLLIGLLHGLAGSAGVVLMHAMVADSVIKQLIHLFAFSAGSVLGMGLFCVFFNKIALQLGRVKWLQLVVPSLSVLYGCAMIYQNL